MIAVNVSCFYLDAAASLIMGAADPMDTYATMQYLKEAEPNTPITREIGEYEAPLSNRKAREVLGFKEEHPWYKYVKM